MEREVARALLHDVREVLHGVDPAKLYSSVDEPSRTDYDDLALAAMRVLTEGGSGAAATDAVVQVLRDERGVKIGLTRKSLLKRGLKNLQIT